MMKEVISLISHEGRVDWLYFVRMDNIIIMYLNGRCVYAQCIYDMYIRGNGRCQHQEEIHCLNKIDIRNNDRRKKGNNFRNALFSLDC